MRDPVRSALRLLRDLMKVGALTEIDGRGRATFYIKEGRPIVPSGRPLHLGQDVFSPRGLRPLSAWLAAGTGRRILAMDDVALLEDGARTEIHLLERATKAGPRTPAPLCFCGQAARRWIRRAGAGLASDGASLSLDTGHGRLAVLDRAGRPRDTIAQILDGRAARLQRNGDVLLLVLPDGRPGPWLLDVAFACSLSPASKKETPACPTPSSAA